MSRVITPMLAAYPVEWLTCHCGRAFVTPEARVLHAAEHEGICVECPDLRFAPAELQAHRRLHVNATPKWIVCATCFVYCRDEAQYARHRAKHTDVPLKLVPRGGFGADSESEETMTETARDMPTTNQAESSTHLFAMTADMLVAAMQECEERIAATRAEQARVSNTTASRIAALNAELTTIEADIVAAVLK